MAKVTKTICDCCEREIQPEDYYIKVQPFYFMRGRTGHEVEYREDFEWYICGRCLDEISKRVAVHNVEFNVETKTDEDGETV